MTDQTHDHPDDGGVHVHVHPTKLYLGILLGLLTLTVATVGVSYVDVDELASIGHGAEGIGAWNLGIALLIATMKGSLVVLFFMHLKDDKRFNALFFLGSLLFVGLFLAYTLNDTEHRGMGDPFNGVHVDPLTGARAPGGIEGPLPGEALAEGLTAPAAPEAAPAAPAPAAPEPADAEPESDEDFIDSILEDGAGERELEADVVEDAAEGSQDFIDEILEDDDAPATDAE